MDRLLKKPLVSIGVPVFNGEKYLNDALEALIKQDYENIEILISDNRSSDKTLEIVNLYKEKHDFIKVSRNKKNIGIHGNFLKLLKIAQGDYFMWAAVDDYWAPTFVSTLIKELEINPNAGIAMCAFNRIYPDGETYDTIRFQGRDDPNRKGHLGIALALTSPLKYNVFIYGLFRKKMLEMTINQFLPVPSGERCFLTQYALAYKFRYVDEILHQRVVHVAPYQDRYPLDEFSKAKLCSLDDSLKLHKIRNTYRVIMESQVIPLYRKMYLPVILWSIFKRHFFRGLKTVLLRKFRKIIPRL